MDMTPHFPIYMDYGATTPCDPRVVDAMFGPPPAGLRHAPREQVPADHVRYRELHDRRPGAREPAVEPGRRGVLPGGQRLVLLPLRVPPVHAVFVQAAAELGAHAQCQAAGVAGHVEQLQRADGQVAGGVAANRELLKDLLGELGMKSPDLVTLVRVLVGLVVAVEAG